MLGLVRKRHDGDGWLVFSELSNKPGGHDRYADAFALGVWAGTKYEAHLYEFKASRGDLIRELRDPTKAEGVGKYATYWWLVLEDEKIMADLLIPEAWGILKPVTRGGTRMLSVVRKAPKLKPQPFTEMFAVSLIRNMAKKWVSKAEHQRVIEQRDDVIAGRDLKPSPDVTAMEGRIRELESENKRLREGIDRFHAESGVDLSAAIGHPYQFGQMGKTFKVADQLHQRIVSGDVRREIEMLSNTAQRMTQHALELSRGAVELRALAGITECEPNCRSLSTWGRGGDCSCGGKPLSEAERKIASDVNAGTASDPDSIV